MCIEGNFKMPDSEILNIFVVDKLILNEGWKKVKIVLIVHLWYYWKKRREALSC